MLSAIDKEIYHCSLCESGTYRGWRFDRTDLVTIRRLTGSYYLFSINSRARTNTFKNIASVSTPVFVFCNEG